MLLRRSSAAQMRPGRCQQCVGERMQLPRSKAIRPRSRWASLAAALLTSRPYDPAAEWELSGLCHAIPSSPYSSPTVAQTHTAEPCAAGHDDKQSGVSPPTGQRIYRRSHAHSSAADRARIGVGNALPSGPSCRRTARVRSTSCRCRPAMSRQVPWRTWSGTGPDQTVARRPWRPTSRQSRPGTLAACNWPWQ